MVIHMKRGTQVLPAVALALSSLALTVLVGCSSKAADDPNSTVPDNPSLTVIGQDIKFTEKTYAAPAGEVKIAYENKGNQVHNLLLKANDKRGARVGGKVTIGPSEEKGIAFTLTAGTYYMYCDISGHEASMNATLTVT